MNVVHNILYFYYKLYKYSKDSYISKEMVQALSYVVHFDVLFSAYCSMFFFLTFSKRQTSLKQKKHKGGRKAQLLKINEAENTFKSHHKMHPKNLRDHSLAG